MKKAIENLEAVLLHMAALYMKLLEHAEVKREAIIAGDIVALEEIVESEYKLLEKVSKAEEMRVTLALQVEDECGIEPNERPAKLSRIISCLGDDGKKLGVAQARIKEVIEKFRYRNRQNEELLKASLAHVNEFMAMIKERAGKNRTYNKTGYDYGGGLSILDRRV